MGNFSFLAAITSLFTYFQNLGLTINLPSLHMSDNVKKIMTFISNAFQRVEALIPSLPPFDVRAQIVLLSLGVPLILDILFVWFTIPLGKILLHMLDVASTIGASYIFSSIIFGQRQLWTYIVGPLLVVYIVVRLILHFCIKKKDKGNLMDIVFNICNYHLDGIVPGIKSKVTIEELNEQVQRFADNIELVAPNLSLTPTLIFLFVGLIFCALGFWIVGIIPIPNPIPRVASDILPLILFPLGSFSLLIFLLKVTSCGRKVIRMFKIFCQRWGLRLLMLALDLLYIPVLSIFMSLMIPSRVSCGAGQYLHPTINTSYWYNPFMNHTAVCSPCTGNYSDASFCSSMCSGGSSLRVSDDHALDYVQDVITTNGGVFLYAVGAVMIGIPYLWYTVINRNQKLVFIINAFGKTPDDKWYCILDRLQSTGIFLFSPYKYNHSLWGVFLIFLKFLIMAITVLSIQIFTPIIFFLPIFYMIALILVFRGKPYLNSLNTVIDILLYFFNLIFTLIPVIHQFGTDTPERMSTIISLIIAFLPIASTALVFFVGRKKSAAEKEDPTVVKPLSDEEREKRIESMKKQKKKKNKRKDGYTPIQFSKQESSGNNIDDSIDDFEFPEDEVAIENGELDSICEVAMRAKRQKTLIGPEEQGQMNLAFVVNSRTVAKRMDAMYKMVDVVLDGSTMLLITGVLNVAVQFGAIVFGWYIGSVLQQYPIVIGRKC